MKTTLGKEVKRYGELGIEKVCTNAYDMHYTDFLSEIIGNEEDVEVYSAEIGSGKVNIYKIDSNGYLEDIPYIILEKYFEPRSTVELRSFEGNVLVYGVEIGEEHIHEIVGINEDVSSCNNAYTVLSNWNEMSGQDVDVDEFIGWFESLLREELHGETITSELLDTIQELQEVNHVMYNGYSGLDPSLQWYTVYFTNGEEFDVYLESRN